MELEKIKKKREGLLTNYNSLIDKRVELEKQLEMTTNDILTMKGAILLCNEIVEEEKVKEDTPIVNDLDKEKDGRQKDKLFKCAHCCGSWGFIDHFRYISF